jgi:hypothetical protein
MVLESGGRSFSISSSGSADLFINAGKSHRRGASTGENGDDDEIKTSEEAIRDREIISESSVDMAAGKQSWQAERAKWWKVYLMHFLFMWNSRTYEYVSVSCPNFYYLHTHLIR